MSTALTVLLRRSDFVAAAQSGFKCVKSHVIVQSNPRLEQHPTIRFGVTATKAIGNAIIRNRCKRRLRAAARVLLTQWGIPGVDYVFVSRKDTARCSSHDLTQDMMHALKSLSRTMKKSYSDIPSA